MDGAGGHSNMWRRHRNGNPGRFNLEQLTIRQFLSLINGDGNNMYISNGSLFLTTLCGPLSLMQVWMAYVLFIYYGWAIASKRNWKWCRAGLRCMHCLHQDPPSTCAWRHWATRKGTHKQDKHNCPIQTVVLLIGSDCPVSNHGRLIYKYLLDHINANIIIGATW